MLRDTTFLAKSCLTHTCYFQIIETMSYTDNVANFMHVLGPFYEAVYDGQEPENLRRNPSPQLSEGMEKDHQEDESGYSSSINGTGAEETGNSSKDIKGTTHRVKSRQRGKKIEIGRP